MSEAPPNKKQFKSPTIYFTVAFLALAISIVLMRLWHRNLRVPFVSWGDGLFHTAHVKGICETGWQWDNPSLGMPQGANLRDFPHADALFALLVKFGSLFTSDAGLLINLLLLVTFPLTALTTFHVFRRLKISLIPATFGSLLYTFVPYHIYRGVGHMWLAVYFVVPMIALVALWLCTDTTNAHEPDQEQARLSWRHPKVVFSLATCALIGSTGVYYAFFGCYLLLVAGVMTWINRHCIRPMLQAGILIAVIVMTLAVDLSPCIINQMQHGRTILQSRRPVEAEEHGLKLAQLLLPMIEHRIGALAQVRSRYLGSRPPQENEMSALGFIGGFGFVFLLGWLLKKNTIAVGAKEADTCRLLDAASVLNLSSFLLATIGGFGALFALLISPMIRAYNRISIYIAFFSILAVVLLLEMVFQRHCKTKTRRVFFGAACSLLLVLGILDQSIARWSSDDTTGTTSYQRDDEFVRAIEAALPSQAMVFQLPVVGYGFPGPEKMEDPWCHFKGYVHSKHLRWSYGAVIERSNFAWQDFVMNHPASKMIEIVACAGFNGIYVDRFGYSDNGAKLEAELQAVLGHAPSVVSQDRRLSFFNLTNYADRLRKQRTVSEWEDMRKRALFPPVLWVRGFYWTEGTPGNEWRWSDDHSELQLGNPTAQPQQMKLSFGAGTLLTRGNLIIKGPGFSDQLKVAPTEVAYSKVLTLPPGASTIKFTCDVPTPNVLPDPRQLVFKVRNLRLERVD
jgi:phosphoglycerol transferase